MAPDESLSEPIAAFVGDVRSGESIEVLLLDDLSLVMDWIYRIHAYQEPEAEEQFEIGNLAPNRVLAGTLPRIVDAIDLPEGGEDE